LRLLLITGAFPSMKCGIGDYTAMLAQALAQHENMSVEVLTDSAADPNSVAGVAVFPLIADWKLSEIATVMRVVKERQPDVVHIQYPAVNFGKKPMPHWLPFILRLMGKTVVQTWHEPYDVGMCFHNLPNAITKDTLVVVEPDYKQLVPAWFSWLLSRKRFRCISLGSNIPKMTLSESERSAIKSRYGAQGHNLLAYFGFASPVKGIEQLFEIADPALDRIVLICDLESANPCHRKLLELVNSEPWRGKAFVTGFVPPEEAGRILAAADAAAYPFLGGASWRNASVLAARVQRTFVLTTSRERRGYSAEENSYYAALGDYAGMRAGLRRHVGQRTADDSKQSADWEEIADAHILLYREILQQPGPSSAEQV
jgi:glycosyltransferase involved in cell wall biosynthesis